MVLFPKWRKLTGPVVPPVKMAFVGRPAAKKLKMPLLHKAWLETLRLQSYPLDD